MLAAGLVSCWLLPAFGAGAQALHPLTGKQVRERFTAKVLTDDTHWRETYAAGGRLLVEEMGQGASVGTWRIEGDRLCKLRPGILDECYAVWADGDRVELRHPKYQPLEGFLRSRTALPKRASGRPPTARSGS